MAARSAGRWPRTSSPSGGNVAISVSGWTQSPAKCARPCRSTARWASSRFRPTTRARFRIPPTWSWSCDRPLFRGFQKRRALHQRRHDADRGRHHRVRPPVGSAAVPYRHRVRAQMAVWRPDCVGPPHDVRDPQAVARARRAEGLQPGLARPRRDAVPAAGASGRHAARGHRHRRAARVAIEARPRHLPPAPGDDQPARRARDGTGDHRLPEAPPGCGGGVALKSTSLPRRGRVGEGERRRHATNVGTASSELRPRTPQDHDGYRAESLAGPSPGKDSRRPLSTPSSYRPYVADFACLKSRMIIKLDGSQHVDRAAYNDQRTQFLEAQNFRVLRFWNGAVLDEREAVIETIIRAILNPDWRQHRDPLPSPPPSGEGE